MPKPLTDKSAFEESMVWVQRVPSFHSHSIKFHPYSPKGLGSCNPSSFKSIALDSLYGIRGFHPLFGISWWFQQFQRIQSRGKEASRKQRPRVAVKLGSTQSNFKTPSIGEHWWMLEKGISHQFVLSQVMPIERNQESQTKRRRYLTANNLIHPQFFLSLLMSYRAAR